jgi:hypothetical protein
MSGAVSPDSKFVYFDGLDPWYLDVQGGEVKAKRPILRHEPMEGGEILPSLRKFKKQLSEGEFKTVDGKKVSDEKYVDFMDVDNESEFETRFPPMLRTQGVKTQAEWLYRFLKAPYPIRPTLQPIYPGAKALPDINLRMPSFFETKAREEEAAALVHWFAERDQDPAVESYPHTNFPEREPAFLEARKGAQEKAGAIIKDANTGCASCHYMSGQAPPGAVLKHAPDLARVEERLRPRWLFAWQADPSAIYPGTTMTMYDFKPVFKESKEPQADGVHAAVEYLLNYSRYIQKSSAKQ